MEPNYEEICKHVGHLYLQSRHEIESLSRRVSDQMREMQARIKELEKERDEMIISLSNPEAE